MMSMRRSLTTNTTNNKKYNNDSKHSSISSCGFEEINDNDDYDNDDGNITIDILSSFNVSQERDNNLIALNDYGGINRIIEQLEIDITRGLEPIQVLRSKKRFGINSFPLSKLNTFIELLCDALSDTTLVILLIAAAVSIVVGTIENPKSGYAEGVAIYIAVFLAASISAFNDYSKQIAFRSLEQSAQSDERVSALRNGKIESINPVDVVIGDILVLQPGDLIAADCILLTKNIFIESDEASLTGETKSVKKSIDSDPFLLSSCLVVQGEQCHALVIGIGVSSQWGRIKENLVIEPVNTPLQDKLAEMTKVIGYIGMGVAICTAISLIANIWSKHWSLHD